MRVILTKNVPNLGAVGDVCEVAPGYGRNFLIPQGMAIAATPGAMNQVETLRRLERRRMDRVRADMEDLAKRIGRLRLTFPARVGETGRLYGSITAANIAEAIEAELGQEFDRRKIVLEESLRTLGGHAVPIHLMAGVDAAVHVEVVSDGELVPDAPVAPGGEPEAEAPEAEAPESAAPEAAADLPADLAHEASAAQEAST